MTDERLLVLAKQLEAIALHIQATRALAVVDLESTGTNAEVDRIVELAIARYNPDTRECEGLETRVNPGVPIPIEASSVHGITDADVASAPRFSQIAARVDELLAGADIIGFHQRKFDVRMIAAELFRCGLPNPFTEARTIDVGLIFKQREPRTLDAALRFFCGLEHEGAHGAGADIVATLHVLLSQFTRYPDLPRTVDGLDAIGRDPSWLDRDGKIVWRGGEACIGFGKYAGVSLRTCDRGFLGWMLAKDFPKDTKAIISAALRGEYPVPPAAPVEA